MIKGFHHVSFTVQDVDRSIIFYKNFFGMKQLSKGERDPSFSEKVTAIKDAHLKIAYLEFKGLKLELIQYKSPPKMRDEVKVHNIGLSHISFTVDDLFDVFNELKSKGVKFRSEPVEIPTGGMKGGFTVLLSDPDGNGIELIQPPKEG